MTGRAERNLTVETDKKVLYHAYLHTRKTHFSIFICKRIKFPVPGSFSAVAHFLLGSCR